MITNFLDDAYTRLLQLFNGSAARWEEQLPGGSFTHEDENKIRFSFRASPRPPIVISFWFVACVMQGLDGWMEEWTGQGLTNIPGTDIFAVDNETGIVELGSAKLTFGVNLARPLP